MKEIAFVVGICAVACFALSYLQRDRKNIVILALVSRVLYVAQYVLLGAYAGAVLDVLSAISITFAQNKDRGFVARHKMLVFFMTNVAIVGAGITLALTVDGGLGLLSMLGVLLQTDALWLKKERNIRITSIAGCPSWFAYNFLSGAYASCVGDVLSFVSLSVSIVRYDLLKLQTNSNIKDEENKL